MTVAIALAKVSTSYATAPVILDPGDVIIGDLEGTGAPATGSSIFVFPDAINLNLIVSDDTTPDNQIKWSYTFDIGAPGGNNIRINGVPPVDPGLVGLDDDDPTSPNQSKRVDLHNTDTGQAGDVEDGDPFTATFRNIVLSPANTPAYIGSAGFITSQTATITLFASDCGTFSQRTITVFSAHGSSDSISGGGPQLIKSVNFGATTDGWIGGAFPGFGGSVSSGASGLCLIVPLTGSNDMIWISPERYIDLVANTIYRARLNVTMTPASPAADTIPLWFFQYDNFNTGGGGNNYGGFSWVLDAVGGAEGIGRGNGRTQYDFWFAPNSVATAQWNSGAFVPAADAVNDIRIGFRSIDANAALTSDLRVGTICMGSIEISSSLHDNLQGTTVFNPPINTATHFVPANGEASQGTSSITNGTASASIHVNTAADSRQTFGPFDPLQSNLNKQLYPVIWQSNTLYRLRVRLKAATSETDPLDAIFMALDVATNELGSQGFTTSNRGAAVMDKSASPKLTAATYEGYLFSQNVTSSTQPDANRLRPIPFFFNTTNLFGTGTGGDTIIVDQMEVDAITNGIN